ncbi:MAG TPA: gliding motility-associated C-terminal domain-containing protein [Bacteroidia bacterium]|nr:gliding motility-associated C-terminal domain-containing protein [Bacteroidia bacterium]
MKRLLLLISILLCSFTGDYAQTLYWVGGSGTFNDPNHWSLISGGPTANQMPTSSTDVVFDDKSGTDWVNIDLPLLSKVRSFNSQNKICKIVFANSGNASLNIQSSFHLSTSTYFDFAGDLIFRSPNSNLNNISFNLNSLKCNVFFYEGEYNLYPLFMDHNKTISFENGNYHFRYSSLTASDVSVKGNATKFFIDTSYFNISNSFKIQNAPVFNANKFGFYAPFSSPSVNLNNANFGSGAKLVDNKLNAVCQGSITTFPECSGPCTGSFSLSIDASCTGTYNLVVGGDPSCSTTANNIATNNLLPGSTYTVGGLCYCAAAQYVATVFDITTFIPIPLTVNGSATSNFNFQAPTYALTTLAQIAPRCNLSCNGSMTLNAGGGTFPYTITVNPATTPSVINTAGGFTVGGMCGNITYTFTIIDKNGCSGKATKLLIPPPPLLAGGSTASITCFGACTGSTQVSPTGGTPGFTVNWSTGSSVAIGVGGTSSLTSLCASVSPITATVTDAKGCTAIYSSPVLQPASALTATKSQTNVTCGGLCNASAQVNPSGGTPGYSFTWTPAPGAGQGTSLASALCGSNVPAPTNYTVTIMDANQCSIIKTFAISQPPPITLTPTFTNALCNGTCNASATAGQAGGTPPFTFTWTSPGPIVIANTQSVTGLCGGFPVPIIYTIAVTDASLCVNQTTVSISEPPPISLSVASTSVTCFGQCTGSSTATATGGSGGFTYTWSPTIPVITGQGTATVSALCAGNYTLTVANGICTVSPIPFTISQPTQINSNFTTTSITCNGLCNGIINSTPSGGTGPYNYTLTSTTFTGVITNSTSASFGNLCASATAGIYTLSVGDVTSNCVRTQTINLLQPNPISIIATTSSITCFGQCNASLSGSAFGGSPVYTFTWTTPAPATFNTPIISGQCAGTYTLDVKDANGCSTQTIVTVAAPVSMVVALTPVSPSCNGGCNGSITSTVSGGTPAYTYNWTTGSTATSINGLCIGNYSLTVTDANGCQKTTSTTVAAPPPIAITTTAIPTTCAGSCNGQALSNASGGTPPYVYSWSTIPVTTNTTGTASNLCSGNYVVTVTDANGCINNANVTITSPLLLSVAILSVQPSCNICIGAATVAASGGNPGYVYTWSPLPGAGQGSPTPSGLCVGVYTVVVVDTKGCSKTQTINVAQSVIVSITTTGTLLTCNNGCTGIANANPSGGTPPYTYTWSPVGGNSSTASGLCAGPYTVNVTDASGCLNSSSITFVNPPAINITSTVTNASCNGNCNGTIKVTASGGTGAISYTWSPAPGAGQGTPNATGLCAGTYTLDVKDANNCLKTQTFLVSQPNALSAGFTPVSPSTCGGTNGSITATASGGTPAYTYTWTPSAQTTSVAVNLGAGSYALTIKDAAGCTQTLVATLSDPTGPTITVTSSSVTCHGSCNGSATVSVVGSPPININWPSPINSTNTAVSGLCQGTFAVNVSDATNCLTSQTVTVVEPPTFSLNPVVTNPNCGVACDGTITTSAAGGTAPYSFTWTPGAVNSPTLNNICGGSYTANIADGNNCHYSQVFVVTQPSSLTITFTKRNVLCNGACNGTVTATASGGSGPYTYSWTPIGLFPGSILNNLINLCPNAYSVTVTDANGCSTTSIITIVEPLALTGTLSVKNALCNSQCNGSATITAAGGTPNFTYGWTGSAATTSVVNGLCAGNYSNTVTDANGCTLTQSFVIVSPPLINVTVTPTNPTCNGICNGSITTIATGGTGVLTYSWIATGVGQNPTGLCAGNYTVIVTDANNCTGQNVTVLTNPPALLANAIFTNPSCPGSCNGTAISNPANGTAPYSYTWTTGPVQNTQSVSSLCSGTYSVIVMDSKACVDTQQVVLIAPATLTINPSSTAATCSLFPCNGSINVLPLGGTPNYTLTWNPAVSATTVAVNLCAGIYTVTVTDSKACSSNFFIPLSNSNGPTGATVSFTDVACNGQCNGSASVTNPIGGTPSYTIVWVTPSTASNPIFGLCAGTYTAKITDANNCLFFQSVPINQPAVLNASTTVTQPLCGGNCNGIVTSSPVGGNPAYTYSWSTGATTSSVTNLCPGNYTLTVTDTKTCITTQTFSLPGAVNITASSVAVNNNCFGNCNGSLLATSVAGGLPPYSFNWSDPLGQSTAQAFNLCNGNYFVVIKDAQGCFDTIRGTVISPSALTLTSSVVQPSCGVCNGSSTVSALGGTAPYTYTWSSGSTSAAAANLCAGIYMVTITDNKGCLQNINVPINNSSTLTETITSTNETCFAQCNGAATVTAGGGTPPITYNWLSPVSASQSVSSLCAGIYFVQMTDAMGCIRNASVNISSANNLTITPFVKQPGCAVNNGSISLTVTGGNPGYTYSWTPGGATTSSVTGLGVGSYTVRVTDLSGCTKTMVFPLTNVNSPGFNFSSVNALCSGTCNAVASLSVTSGTAPFTFNWSSGTVVSGANTSTASGLCSGIVTATVTSTSNGCLSVQSVTLSQPPQLLLSLPILNTPKCSNQCNGSITLIPSGGVLPYTYTWTPPGATNPIINLCAGNYSSTVKDANGCSISNTYTLINPPVLNLGVNIVNSSCNTAPDGAITTTVSGGLPVYTYSWTSLPAFTSTNSSLSNVLSGTYSLTLTDFAGCKKDTAMIIVPTISVQAEAGKDSSFCQSGSFVLNGSLSSGGTTYNWFLLPSAVSFTNTLITTVAPPVGTSTYVLVAANGVCISRDTVKITSNIPPIVNAGPNYTITIFTSTVIGGSPTSATGVTFTWIPSSTLDNGSLPNPTASNTVNTSYTVMVTDAKGCVGSDTMHVYIFPEIFIPNGFSPNSDGKNDYWVIDNIQQFPNCVVEVYNRWGELLFVSTGYNTPWDGRYKGKELPVGTYYYIIDLHHVNFPKAYTGPLTIFR